jgi:hypothetical protein
MQCASANNRILFIGGWYEGGNRWYDPIPVDIYDISSNTVSIYYLIPDDPQKFSYFRFGASIASVGNKILFGGGGDGMGDNLSSEVDIYDASNNTWSVAHLSAAREGLAAATVGDKVLFTGGFGYANGNTWGDLNTVDIYDNNSNTWSTATLSEARMDINATTAGNKIYFAGGRNGTNVSKTIDIYDAATNSWSVSLLQQPRTGMASMSAGDKIFWAGGANSLGTSWLYNDNTEILDITSGLTTNDCLIPRTSFNAVKKNEHIVFFTGNTSDQSYLGTHFEIYNITTKKWSTGVLNKRIYGAAIISVNNIIYVAGGTDGNTKFKQIWKLEF